MATATYIPIASQTLGSAAASITFNSIPGTYTDLHLVITGNAPGTNNFYVFRINSDNGTNYSRTTLTGNGSAASSVSNVNITVMSTSFAGTSSTTVPLFDIWDFFSYAGSTNKTILCSSAQDANGSGQVGSLVGLWRSTSAITSITIYASDLVTNLPTGTIATLWGI